MQVIKIETTPRADFGKKASRALRREGLVPGVLYGGGETVSFTVSAKALKPLIYTPNSYIVELVIDGKTEKAVMREVQFHPVREEILHIDFYRVQEGKPVAITVPVRLTGNAEGVKVGGKLVLSTRKLVVSGMVDKLQVRRPEVPHAGDNRHLCRTRNACFAQRRSGRTVTESGEGRTKHASGGGALRPGARKGREPPHGNTQRIKRYKR